MSMPLHAEAMDHIRRVAGLLTRQKIAAHVCVMLEMGGDRGVLMENLKTLRMNMRVAGPTVVGNEALRSLLLQQTQQINHGDYGDIYDMEVLQEVVELVVMMAVWDGELLQSALQYLHRALRISIKQSPEHRAPTFMVRALDLLAAASGGECCRQLLQPDAFDIFVAFAAASPWWLQIATFTDSHKITHLSAHRLVGTSINDDLLSLLAADLVQFAKLSSPNRSASVAVLASRRDPNLSTFVTAMLSNSSIEQEEMLDCLYVLHMLDPQTALGVGALDWIRRYRWREVERLLSQDAVADARRWVMDHRVYDPVIDSRIRMYEINKKLPSDLPSVDPRPWFFVKPVAVWADEFAKKK